MAHVFPKDFSEPVLALTTLGEAAARTSVWPDYSGLDISSEHIPELLRILTQIDDFWPAVQVDDAPEIYAPIHAWRALGQLKTQDAILVIINLIIWNEDNNMDWIMEETPDVMAMIGPACIPPLRAYLLDPEKKTWSSVTMSHCLSEIGKQNPESRAACVQALQAGLEQYASNDETVNAFLISFLTDLEAIEVAPLVERAYQAGVVDLSVLGDFEDFQVELGLLKERRTPKQRPSWLDATAEELNPDQIVYREDEKKQRQQEKKEKLKQKQARKARKKNKKR